MLAVMIQYSQGKLYCEHSPPTYVRTYPQYANPSNLKKNELQRSNFIIFLQEGFLYGTTYLYSTKPIQL